MNPTPQNMPTKPGCGCLEYRQAAPQISGGVPPGFNLLSNTAAGSSNKWVGNRFIPIIRMYVEVILGDFVNVSVAPLR